eukprot:1508777-Pyramimonas_sp.AAC.1
MVRHILRKRLAPTYDSEKDALIGILNAENIKGPRLSHEEQRHCLEWLTTALRHKPLHNNYISDRFLRAAPSFDEFDGWVELAELLDRWPPAGYDRYHRKDLETARQRLRNRHWACQASAVLDLIGMVDNTGMQKNRLQLKKCQCASEARETYFIRSSNGHSSPGIKCPESLYMRITDLIVPGAPGYFIHGTQWASIPNILSIGLSCRADDTSKKRGIQFVHACPYLPGDTRIHSGLCVDSEALVLVSLKNLLRDSMSIWRSANDIMKSAGRSGRIPPIHIVQLI